MKPTNFKFVENIRDDGRSWRDSLTGYFGPGWGWNRFSYRKALRKTDPTMASEFSRLCRERWSAVWRPQFFHGGTCEAPACWRAACDVDHDNPTHKEIVEACWPKVSLEDQAAWWKTMLESDGDRNHFCIPEGHPAAVLYDEMTVNGMYRHLCKEHHKPAAQLTFRGKRLVPGAQRVEEGSEDLDGLFDELGI